MADGRSPGTIVSMVPTVHSKLPSSGVSIFATMTRLANEHGAINLSQGFPDFHCEPQLLARVARYMWAGHNQYAPMPGQPALREALAMKYKRLYGRRYDPVTEIAVTTGATEVCSRRSPPSSTRATRCCCFSPPTIRMCRQCS